MTPAGSAGEALWAAHRARMWAVAPHHLARSWLRVRMLSRFSSLTYRSSCRHARRQPWAGMAGKARRRNLRSAQRYTPGRVSAALPAAQAL